MVKKVLSVMVAASLTTALFNFTSYAADESQLDEIIVNADIDRNDVSDSKIQPIAGGNVNNGYQGGITGSQSLHDTPFTVVSFTSKTIKDYSDPTQPLPSVIANNPSVRTTATTFYDDFSIRGNKLNGYQLYLNGIPGLFEQGSTPVNFLSRIDVTAGPAMALNNATSKQSTGGLVNMVSKKAEDTPITDVTLSFSGRSTFTEQIDVGRRFGENNEWGIRVNALNTDGETAIPNEKKTQRNVFVNIDHKNENSKTNLLLGYIDDHIKDSLRWFTFDSNLSSIPHAPNIHRNYGFKSMTWKADKWIATLNHEQKINDNWNVFINAGYGRYDIYHSVNSDWRYTIRDDGSFDDSAVRNPFKAVRNPFKYDNKSMQIGINGSVKTGAIKHNLTIAADKFWGKFYNSKSWTFGKIGGTLDKGITY